MNNKQKNMFKITSEQALAILSSGKRYVTDDNTGLPVIYEIDKKTLTYYDPTENCGEGEIVTAMSEDDIAKCEWRINDNGQNLMALVDGKIIWGGFVYIVPNSKDSVLCNE